ncbi:MAG: HAMP domain-containing protein [Rhodospirillaceae bacterium]|nr:HAMP domain-containing protein [Rhodospirillaceae bacterium]MYB12413.1 HAMP domain-containing protein [Rhodospirillaceae bacterium]MYI50901.1 HAMP domain-containing protein [Rhodospirillaceae bacterium]
MTFFPRSLSTQLYLGIGGAVFFTIVASLVGWISFDRVGDVQSRVNEGSVPEMAAAFAVAQQSGALVAAAPRLTAAATPGELARIAGGIADDRRAFEAQLKALTGVEGDASRSEALRRSGQALMANIEAIEASMARRFELAERHQARLREVSALRGRLVGGLIPLIDDQLFYAVTGYRQLGRPPAPPGEHRSQAAITRYRHFAELRADATTGAQLLAAALNVSDASLLEPLRESFEATARGIKRRLSRLGDDALGTRLTGPFGRLIALGEGPDNVFGLRARELAIDGRQRDLLERNRSLAVELVAAAEGLVRTARVSVREATLASAEAILTGRNLLLLISAVSVVGAVLLSWIYVGRFLSRRLGRLSDRMRRMAEGDLEAEVDIGGRDEVGEMAAALEVFRRHALEVQRLNLVEKLAEELKSKNDQLETALGDLEKAQDQIVMREKLAALGELTAGVAHEIKNPLNFIKNFSEVSVELMEELLAEVRNLAGDGKKPDAPDAPDGGDGDGGDGEDGADDGGADDDTAEIIEEIAGDLTDNLKTIHEHGERANNIVQSMLQMGRGSGERRPANINALLSEHAKLAYHSARATDPDFNLDMQEDLDPDIGEIEVIPQDLSRVFLNMVTNACYATHEKRMALKESDPDAVKLKEGGADYEPRLRLTTRGTEDGVEIRIRDNGSGIPDELVEKIFHPFFTTKPTDQGTGLGLALSSDIIRQHGGHIRVETEAGEFTEMIIDLPKT